MYLSILSCGGSTRSILGRICQFHLGEAGKDPMDAFNF